MVWFPEAGQLDSLGSGSMSRASVHWHDCIFGAALAGTSNPKFRGDPYTKGISGMAEQRTGQVSLSLWTGKRSVNFLLLCLLWIQNVQNTLTDVADRWLIQRLLCMNKINAGAHLPLMNPLGLSLPTYHQAKTCPSLVSWRTKMVTEIARDSTLTNTHPRTSSEQEIHQC